MSKPYQTETYDIDDGSKEYIILSNSNFTNQLKSATSDAETFTLGTDAYDTDPAIDTGKFNVINKTSSINYSNGIITINKSGNYRLTFTSLLFLDVTDAPLFVIKKNGISIAEIAISTTGEVSGFGAQQTIMFLSPIFSINYGDNVRIDVSINNFTGIFIGHEVFLQEI